MRRLTLETAREHAQAARDARELRELAPGMTARELRALYAGYGCSVRTQRLGQWRSWCLKRRRRFAE